MEPNGPPAADDGAVPDAAVAALLAGVRALAVEPVGALSGEALASRVVALEDVRRALDAASAAALGELEASGWTDEECGHRTRVWMAVERQLPRGEGARRVAVARLLRRLPVLAGALADGRVSVHHVAVIEQATNDRNMEFVEQMQSVFVDMCQGVRFERWAGEVRELLELVDDDGGHEPRPEDNRLRTSRGVGGNLLFEGVFVGEWAEVFTDAVRKQADRLFRRYAQDEEATGGDLPIPSRSALEALAVVELIRRAIAADAAGTRLSAPAAEVDLVIHSDDMEAVRGHDGHRVDPHTASLFCCDPVIYPLVIDSLGIPLDAGRSIRFADRTQRRATGRRDGGCVFPGCDAHVGWTDVHHVIEWQHDGRSDLRFLASLCRHHHGVVHRTGWTMDPTEDQWFTFTTPSGRILHSQRHGRPRTPAPA